MQKVVVDHTGSCGGCFFQEGVEVELPAEVVKALGDSAQPVEPKKKAETKKEEKAPTTENTEKKEEGAK